MKLGIDHLLLAHPRYPLELAADLHPKGWGIGVFDGLVGRVGKPLRKFLKRAKCVSFVRIQADWSNHKLVTMRDLKRRCKQYKKLTEEFPNIVWYISHSCEHWSRNKKAVRRRLNIIKKRVPRAIAVNCPNGPGVRIPGYLNEEHGAHVTTPEPFAVSMDGTDITTINVKQWKKDHAKAEYLMAWRHSFNMRKLGVTPPPPKERKLIPTEREINDVITSMKG